jgi:hypothetical protein
MGKGFRDCDLNQAYSLPHSFQKVNSGQFPPPAMSAGGQVSVESKIASRFGASRVHAPRGSGRSAATSPGTVCARHWAEGGRTPS